MNDTSNQTPQRPDEHPKRVQLSQKASELIVGDRQVDYGPPIVNFQRIANLWNTHTETNMFTPRLVAELMFLLKLARTAQSPTEDSYIDMIGYAAIAGEFADIENIDRKKYDEGLKEWEAELLKNQNTDDKETNVDG